MGIYAAMRLTSIESSFHPYNIYRDCPQGRPKCVLDSLEVANCLHPHNGWRQRHTGVTLLRYPNCALGWLQKLTHVPLAIVILLVVKSCVSWLLGLRADRHTYGWLVHPVTGLQSFFLPLRTIFSKYGNDNGLRHAITQSYLSTLDSAAI